MAGGKHLCGERVGALVKAESNGARIFGLLFLACIILTAASAAPSTRAAQRAAKKPGSSPKMVGSYVCPMDADVRAARPGKCPKCGMALEKAKAASGDAGTLRPAAEREASAGEAPASDGAVSEGVINLAQIPDVAVYDQNGRQLRFYSDLIKGKTVAINFVFTTCTTICPPLTATFRKLQQEMEGRDVSLISISVDPATDLPERLKQFSEKFKAGPGWTFVTGSKPEIDRLLKSLGAYTGDKVNHTPMVLVGNDRANHWTRTYGLAPASTLLKVISEASDKTAFIQVPLPGAGGTERSTATERQVERRIGRPEPTPASVNAAGPAGEAKKLKTPAEAASAYFPNRTLVTQDNKEMRFFDDLLKGKTVLINFAFTSCAGVCPPMTANLAKVQAYLGDRVGKDINMITISVDPATDTPEALKKYAEKFKVKPGWYFLTGKKEDVDAVLTKLGGYVEDKLKHSSILLVGNIETGEWAKMVAVAKPSEIADAVVKIASPGKQE
jgi:protein SCO1